MERYGLRNRFRGSSLSEIENIKPQCSVLFSRLTVAQDLTRMLREGHWASYNVPFYEKVQLYSNSEFQISLLNVMCTFVLRTRHNLQIYNMSGYVDFVESHGVEFSHELAPRAKIFRRDSDKVC